MPTGQARGVGNVRNASASVTVAEETTFTGALADPRFLPEIDVVGLPHIRAVVSVVSMSAGQITANLQISFTAQDGISVPEDEWVTVATTNIAAGAVGSLSYDFPATRARLALLRTVGGATGSTKSGLGAYA